MFRHILCPTDLKERAYVSLKKAVQIAHQFNARITMLNVHREYMDKYERKMLRVSVDKLKKKYRRIAAIETSAAEGVDLIVICTDGRDNLNDFVTGTITEQVINRAHCPVLVIPHRK